MHEHATLRAERHGKGLSVSPGQAFTQSHGRGARFTALSHLLRVPPLTSPGKRARLPVTTEVGRDYLILLEESSFGGYECLEGTSSSRTAPLGPLT